LLSRTESEVGFWVFFGDVDHFTVDLVWKVVGHQSNQRMLKGTGISLVTSCLLHLHLSARRVHYHDLCHFGLVSFFLLSLIRIAHRCV
jgi:hypothetical protein